MKFLDLFSGIGGFRLGMEQAGHECLGYVEWDKFARKSYEAIHDAKGEWTWHDVSTIDYRELPGADIWTFGFPCQDISIANSNKLGFKGNRSSLFFAVTKRLRQIKEWDTSRMPTFLFIENVKNFLSVNNGWDFLAAQIELDEIGYDLEWQVFNTKNYGLPQNRERVFLIGHLRGKRTRRVFPIDTIQSNGKIKIEKDIWIQFQNRTIENKNEIIEYLRSYKNKTISEIAKETGIKPTQLEHYFRIDSSGALPDGDDWMKLKEILGFDDHFDEQMTTYFEDYYKFDMSGRLYEIDGIGPTLTTISGGHQVPFVNTKEGIRELTEKEFWLLQGFTEEQFYKAAKVNSKRQLYRQAGNSVSVPVIYEIAKRLGVDE